MMGRASDIQIEQNIHKEGLVTLVKLFWYLRDFSIMLINNIVLLGMLIFIFMFEIFPFFAVYFPTFNFFSLGLDRENLNWL